MPHYVRILGKKNPTITVDQLNKVLIKHNFKASIIIENGNNRDWTQLTVKDEQDNEFLVIEKNIVEPGQLGADEIQNFKEEIQDCKPKTAVKWLIKFFDKVKVIYAFQILSAIDNKNNWTIFGELQELFFNNTNGIIQADNEGFSNEEGFHILWQFNDTVTGEWNMAVRTIFGGWKKFEMDLGDKKQREEFWKGKVPKNAIKIK